LPEEPEISELLELVKTFTQKGSAARIDQIASRMGRSLKVVQRLADEAIRSGLTSKTPVGIRLTDMGETSVRKHREEYVHQTHLHGGSLTGRVRRFLEGNVRDWHGHWRHHGFDDESLTRFYENLENLQGRIEDTVSLADLREGDKCTVVLAFGGHGMVRRLAEMGLTPGTEVTIVRDAPLRGPIEVFVRGVSLALGRGIAGKVLVRQSADDHASANI
jgi:Fe2+ transport system protein FeoA